MEFQVSTSFSRSQGGNEPPQPPGIAVSFDWGAGSEAQRTCIPVRRVQASLQYLVQFQRGSSWTHVQGWWCTACRRGARQL